MTDPASDLRDLAAWADYCAEWLESAAPRLGDPAPRTVIFQAAKLDEFLAGFRRLGPELERIATDMGRPRLRLLDGGRT